MADRRGSLVLIHCSYHKCLTVLYQRVMHALLDETLHGWRGKYQHFNSDLNAFWADHDAFRVSSVNNHALDLSRLPGARVTRFIRDPRDLVISGYHYHRRGAEDWCRIVNPTDDDWMVVNGTVPSGLRDGESFMSYLQRVDEREGLIAESEFRQRHFASMTAWPTDDDRVMTLRYEDVVGNERAAFGRLLAHYGMTMPERVLGARLAGRFSAGRTKTNHIRDPRAGQWRDAFTPRVREAFTERYGTLASDLGYADE